MQPFINQVCLFLTLTISTISFGQTLHPPPVKTAKPVDVKSVVNIVEPSLFFIITQNGTGSGFLYKDKKTIITNRHVVEGININTIIQLKPVIHLNDGFTDLGDSFSGRLVFKHPNYDIAVIKLSVDLSAVPIESNEEAKTRFLPRGTKIVAHGFPSTNSPLVTTGLISGHYRNPLSAESFYLTDTAMASGSSGGPVTDYAGKLVGIATLVHADDTEIGYGWGYILPSHILNDALEKMSKEPAFNIDKCIQQIKSERDMGKRLSLFNNLYEEMADSCSSIDELTTKSIEFLNRTKRVNQVVSRKDFHVAAESSLKVNSVVLERAIEIGLRDGFNLSGEGLTGSLEFEQATFEWGKALASKIDFESSGVDGEYWLALLLDTFIDSFDKYAYVLKLNCATFDSIDYADPTWFRNLNQRKLIETIHAAMSIYQLEITSQFFVESITIDSPIVFIEKRKELISAMENANEEGSVGCFELIQYVTGSAYEQDPSTMYASLVDAAVKNGFEIIGTAENEIDLQSVDCYTIESSKVARLVYLAAINRRGMDIDLFVYNSKDELLQSDETTDSYPYIEVLVPPHAEYFVCVGNPNEQVHSFELTMMAKDM